VNTPLEQAINILQPLILLLGSWAVAEAARWIRSRVRNEYAQGALLRLNDAVATAARELAQTTVADLKAAAQDGKLTEEEVEELRAKAAANTRAYLGKKGVAELERVVGAKEIEAFIQAKIEAAVHDLKQP